jgi:MSHA biogenesis protein MshQ
MGTGTVVSGAVTWNAATYDNVGSFNLQLVDSTFANVDANDGPTGAPADCSATGRYVCSATVAVGRFVPDHFSVSYNTPVFGTACGSFTYIGQAFNYTTAPVITVTAQDAANNTTDRYRTSGSCAGCFRITNASLTGEAYSAAVGTINTSGLPGTDPVIAQTGTNGVSTLTFGSGTGLLFTRTTPTTPASPYNADISLAINIIDADGVSYASNPAHFGAATTGNGIAFSSGNSMRFGQLVLGNALGSELLNLPIPIQTQYWNGTSFVTNTLDSCTTITASNIVLSNYQGALTSGNLPSGNISISGAFSAGVGNLKLTKPSSAVNGTVDLCVDLGGDATCVGTPAGMSYLQGVWSGTTYTLDPRARAAFGFSKGSYSGSTRDPFVYQRENY